MKKVTRLLAGLAVSAASAVAPAGAAPASLSPEQQQLRAIYQELVETNTTNSTGSCTKAAGKMAARLKAGGFAAADMQILAPDGAAQKGNLVARLKGDGSKKPLLLLAHIDVVEARREDWTRDPFKLVEENGEFYARGASDDKAMASVFVDTMIRFKRERLAARRDVILALTCDEEIVPSKYDGVDFLLQHHRPLIDAELALNEGGGGVPDKNGKPLLHSIQAGEKVFQSFELEVTNPGGHSSVPPRDNAIYQLADGLSRLGRFDFPFRLTDVTRSYYERMAGIETGQVAADMRAILSDPPDAAALARLYALSPRHNAQVRTTCVATMLDGGHASNALPQRARATVNCRILPGEPVEQVRQTLVKVVADERIKVTPVGDAVVAAVPPLTPALMAAVEQISADMWPGVPVVPTMSNGGTDGRFLNNAGIWTYGVSGMFASPSGSGTHGLNEHLPVRSLYEGQQFLYRLSKRLATE